MSSPLTDNVIQFVINHEKQETKHGSQNKTWFKVLQNHIFFLF